MQTYYEIDANNIFIGIVEVGEKSNFEPTERHVTVAPPELQQFEVALWDNGWRIIKNYRGKKVYNLELQRIEIINDLGELPEHVIDSFPPSPYHMWNGTDWVPNPARRADMIQLLKSRINTETDKTILSSFQFNQTAFKLSLENQMNFKTECELRENLTYPHKIKTVDGYYELQNAEEYRLLYLAAVAFIRQTIETGWEQKDELSSKSLEELIELVAEDNHE